MKAPAPLLVLSLITLGWWAPGLAQTGSVRGTVAGPEGPIGQAEVLVQGTVLKATTDAEGAFRLDRVPLGTQVLIVRRIGFRPQALAVTIEAGEKVVPLVALDPGPFKLPEISVKARYAKPARYASTTKYDDFYRRRRLGLGRFLDAEALEHRVALATHEYLRGLPGIRVDARPAGTGSKVRFLRCDETPPAIGVWVDGSRIIPPWGVQRQTGQDARAGARRSGGDQLSPDNDPRAQFVTYMLDNVNPSEIEAMEIYSGPASIPAEFNTGDVCGAIVIWTAEGGRRRPVRGGDQ